MKLSGRLLIILFFVLLFFFTRDSLILDPDFGWHLTTGKYILKSGIPKTDPFSYSMPSYKWIEYEWLSDVTYALAYPAIGIVGLALLQSFIIVLTLILPFYKNLYRWSFLIFLLASGEFSFFGGVRPQIFTWFFLSLLLFVLLDRRRFDRFFFLVPLIFVPWVNLHGGFALGIFTLLLFVVIESLKDKRLYIKGVFVFLLSVLATFINPYTLRIWEVIYNHATDANLRSYVSEWLPGVTMLHPSLLFLIAISLIIVYKHIKRFNKIEIVLFFFLLAASLLSIKQAPLWVILAVIIVNKGILHFKNDLPKIALKRFDVLISVLILIGIFLFILQAYFALKSAYQLSENVFYPKKATEYLNNKHLGKNVFSTFNWGGYLIWHLPQRKFFVDGRMPTWKNLNSGNQSSYAFMEYNDILTGKVSLGSTITRYDIDTVIVPVEKIVNKKSVVYKLKSIGNRLLKEDEMFSYQNLIKQLKDSGFKEVYKDNISIVYRKS